MGRRVGYSLPQMKKTTGPGGTSALILDGSGLARSLREEVRREAKALAGRLRRPPGLRVILVGENPASESYVSGKTKAAHEAGIEAETIHLPGGSAPEKLLAEVERGNRDDAVDGLLVQLPLPPGHDPRRVFDALDPLKDVDGLHPENVGLLHQGRPRFVPCTPAGILALLDAYRIPIAGRRAVVLGRSEIVGKPIAALLTARDATVTLCHSKTPNLPSVCAQADLLVAAIGRPGFITRNFVKKGAAVVDVGMNRLESLEEASEGLRRSARIREAVQTKGRVLVGDVDFEEVVRVAGWLTPVPGGIGPLTVAMLLKNTVQAARMRRGGELTVESPEPMAES
jgi:methylenetetrahydrofolate dehydrogenase (NADP+)/methenyltetrahydrofolate cyclohydrolase